MKRFLNWLIGLWYKKDNYSPPMWVVDLYLRQYRTKEELEQFLLDTRQIYEQLRVED